jgi:hypothetical protein
MTLSVTGGSKLSRLSILEVSMVRKTLFALGVAAVLALAPSVADAQRFHGGFGGAGWRAVDGAAVGAVAVGAGAHRLWVLE